LQVFDWDIQIFLLTNPKNVQLLNLPFVVLTAYLAAEISQANKR
jgi:hypothetical protein